MKTLYFSWYNYYAVDICVIEQLNDFDYKVTLYRGNEMDKFEKVITTSTLPSRDKEAQALCYSLFK